MNSFAFAAHPSVRIKGTENIFNPTPCESTSCTYKPPHLHCPFCVRTEVYQDPVILKAHFRVKHVDKGIEFAGLKVLRCCDHCDIIGVIKGEKKFKGAHWHCYKCKNGFNRRDEAIKHYKTHFRNPQTTFQIQITQDLNQSIAQYNNENQDAANQLVLENNSIHPALTQAVACIASPLNTESVISNGKSNDGALHVTIAANETVESGDGQTIMIIREEQLNSEDSSYSTHLVHCEEGQENKSEHYQALENRCQQLEQEKSQLRNENEELKLHIQLLNDELKTYQSRDKEKINQIANSTDTTMQSLIQELNSQHKDALTQQFGQLKQEFFKIISSKLTSTVAQILTSTHSETFTGTTNKIVEVTSEDLVNSESQTLEIVEVDTGSDNERVENAEILANNSIPLQVSEDGSQLIMCVKHLNVAENKVCSENLVTDVVNVKLEPVDSTEPPEKRQKTD
ncbi:uncharacterized protein LOC126824840 [Patella vulgata]|uniref:uncharacterized protein LOC126824840 n=1 Tax=Patella vulgata TaxID=6465 RepID=UPI00217FDE97|nr:uncharacterized protein LOC126824840 [Patella vulgata]